ncbi:tRNA epoxyqueuosine(34) reductase QueG [Gudongella sp. DL1XJH-153]|uniref:tRNA epoxyqueuosine(34) reductase QueG n=1 Tax=Gudongella sp. DL1XJH-153 TaxID=3409804 RepID=UPI003BB65D14
MHKDKVVEIANDIGIEIIGFTHPGPFERIEEQLKKRSEAQRSTEFEEDDLDLRLDPRKTMKGCKSIIVIGISYNLEYNHKTKVDIKGSLSKSSWGSDYHFVLKDKMESLVTEMKKNFDFDYKLFVDTGPLIDRELAYRAGIGYYGKNCSIINPDYGSFIFIGYILTDLELEIDYYQMESQCGDCTLCLDACPTGALEAPGILNPKICISYLTQTKELIPEELSSRMGIKVYGCDTCQSVCPKNKDIHLSSHQEFSPSKTEGVIDIKELAHMSKKEFKEKYGDMTGSWRGKTVLLRNAVIALENIGARNYIDIIETIDKKNVELLEPYTSRILKNMVE